MVYARLWSRRLDIRIQFQKRQVTEGETVILEEMLENRKYLPLPIVFLQFKLSRYFHVNGEPEAVTQDRYTRNEWMSVLMNQRLTRKVEMVCTRRGNYDIERVSVTARSLFLNEVYVQELDCESHLTVYPRMVDARGFERLLKNINGNQMIVPFMQEDPFLLRGIREYQIYDNMKLINWNATARTGGLKVNLLETVSNRKISVFLNMQKESLAVHNEILEESIRLAKTFCALFSKKGIKSQLYTNGTDGKCMEPICVPEGVGPGYMDQVNESLTRIFLDENGNILTHGREQEVDFVEMYSGLLEESVQREGVVLISGNQDEKILQMLKKLHRKGRQFLWIVPVESAVSYKKDSELKDHMCLWRLNYEGAGEPAKDQIKEAG